MRQQRVVVILLALLLVLSSATARATHANPAGSPGQVLAFQPGRANASSDPVLTWHTFIGGSENDYAEAVAVDRNGNAYVVGGSFATWGSPVRSYTALEDVFVAKLSPNGTLLWHTFLGGSSFDSSFAVAVDRHGNVYVAGSSLVRWESDIPLNETAWDTFVAKLNPNGALLWHTFLGGTGNDESSGIAVDADGNLYVVGTSENSWTSPVRFHSGQEDAYVARLSPNGTLLWNTFLGGSGHDWGHAIAVDGDGNVSVTGQSDDTWGSPVRPFSNDASDWHDAFAAKLKPTGELMWNTFLGGDREDTGDGIAVDANGNAYVAGTTSGDWAEWGAPIRPYSGGPDAFVAKLSSGGELDWNTFLGGPAEGGGGIALDTDANIYAAGVSLGTWGSPVRPYTADGDAFVAKLSTNGELAWNAFLGGSGIDVGNGVAVGATGNVYVGGYSTSTWGLPVSAYSGTYDAFVARIDAEPPLYLPLMTR